MKLESKFRIAHKGERIFGNGPCLLLETIDRLGSLNKAASELNMSYSKAWSIIDRAEKALGYQLLSTYTGGSQGGGSNLTCQAKKLIATYREFCQKAESRANELYGIYFEDR